MSSIISLIALGLLAISSSTVALGPDAVDLGSAAKFVVLGETGITTVPASAITGVVGISPAASTLMTGFSLTLDATGTFSTSTQVDGQLLAASYAGSTPLTVANAIFDFQAAYDNSSSRENPDFTNLGSGEIGSLILTPGLYKWTTGVTIGNDVIISGTESDIFIFQITGTFGISAGTRITLDGGVLAENIIWVVGDAVTLGAAAHLEGVLLGKAAVTLETGTTVNGRVFSQTLVALQQTTIVAPT